jgi:hypothetical protein
MKEERNDELADGPLRLIHVFLSLSLPKKFKMKFIGGKRVVLCAMMGLCWGSASYSPIYLT